MPLFWLTIFSLPSGSGTKFQRWLDPAVSVHGMTGAPGSTDDPATSSTARLSSALMEIATELSCCDAALATPGAAASAPMASAVVDAAQRLRFHRWRSAEILRRMEVLVCSWTASV